MKLAQRQLLGFVGTKLGSCVWYARLPLLLIAHARGRCPDLDGPRRSRRSLAGFFITLNSAMLLMRAYGATSPAPTARACSGCCDAAANDNIGGVALRHRLCAPPIDVVYTWVNGSDPVWLASMLHFKREQARVATAALRSNASLAVPPDANVTSQEAEQLHDIDDATTANRWVALSPRLAPQARAGRCAHACRNAVGTATATSCASRCVRWSGTRRGYGACTW